MAVSALSCLAAAPVAHAGRYHVYGCRTPSGALAPVDGWTGSYSGPFVYASNDCQSGGALNAALDGSVSQPTNAIATWTYTAPPHTTIAAATLFRYGTASSQTGNATSLFWLAAPHNNYDSADVYDQCVATSCNSKGVATPPLSPSNLLDVPSSNAQGATQLFVNAACGGVNGYSCPPTSGGSYSALVRVYASDFTLDTPVAPAVANAVGSLTTASPLTGPQDIAFDASDAGPGLYEVRFKVDGQVVSHAAVDANGGRCQDAGGTTDGTRAFLSGQPCAPSAHIQQSFDSHQVADGMHHLEVVVDNAAGNQTTVLDREVSISNGVGVANASVPRGAVNGVNASDQASLQARWAATKRPRLESRFGRKRQVTGRLTAAGGRPVTGAAIDVLATPTYSGATPLIEGTTRTNPDGTWSFTVPGGDSSRILEFRYRSHVGDTQPAAAIKLELAVHAAISLHINPSSVSVGHTITFRGQVAGGPIPRGGKQLVLEARQPGAGWIEFNVIRTDGQGRYRARYKFRFPGPVTYQFRVLSKYEAAFPFIAGTSPVARVHER
jgi:hypothetical protein